MSFVIGRIKHRLDFFKTALDTQSFSGKNILDYGGNRGNLLADGLESGEISFSNYTCLDVSIDAIEGGRDEWPDANWIHHDALNWQYNPTGLANLKFPLKDNSYDLVLAYSVHTHCDHKTLCSDIEEMYRVCKPGGTIATTILTPEQMEWIIWTRTKEYKNVVSLDSFDNLDTVKLYVNGVIIADEWNQPCRRLVSVYNPEWLVKNLPYESHIVKVPGKKIRANQPVLIIHKP